MNTQHLNDFFLLVIICVIIRNFPYIVCFPLQTSKTEKGIYWKVWRNPSVLCLCSWQSEFNRLVIFVSQIVYAMHCTDYIRLNPLQENTLTIVVMPYSQWLSSRIYLLLFPWATLRQSNWPTLIPNTSKCISYQGVSWHNMKMALLSNFTK